MPIKLTILATVLLSQLLITILAMVLGPSILGWTVCFVGASLLLGVLYFHIHSALSLPLERLRDTIQTVKMEGNLALRQAGSNGATDSTVKTFNELLDNFQSIVGKVMFNSSQVATSAQSLKVMTHQVAEGSQAQQDAAEAASQAIEEMIGNIQNIAENAKLAAANARESRSMQSMKSNASPRRLKSPPPQSIIWANARSSSAALPIRSTRSPNKQTCWL